MAKGRLIIKACCVLLVAVCLYMGVRSRSIAPGKLLVNVTGQEIVGESLVVSFSVTNIGSRTLVNGGACEATYQIDNVWVTNTFGAMPSTTMFLLPGDEWNQKVSLPRHITRFKVGYNFEVARARVSLACRLIKSGWSKSLGWLVDMVPFQRGDYVDFWSVETEAFDKIE